MRFLGSGITPEDAALLISAVTEITYTNMYAAISWNDTYREVNHVVEVLGKYGHGIPDLDALPESSRFEHGGWGAPVSDEQLTRIRELDWLLEPPASL